MKYTTLIRHHLFYSIKKRLEKFYKNSVTVVESQKLYLILGKYKYINTAPPLKKHTTKKQKTKIKTKTKSKNKKHVMCYNLTLKM